MEGQTTLPYENDAGRPAKRCTAGKEALGEGRTDMMHTDPYFTSSYRKIRDRERESDKAALEELLAKPTEDEWAQRATVGRQSACRNRAKRRRKAKRDSNP
jgi:hypothetical protein